MLILVLTFIMTIGHQSKASMFVQFPKKLFFKSNSYYIEHYLCHNNHYLDRCCSCDENCQENCCIDVAWNEFANSNTTDYITHFIADQKSKRENGICQPVIPWLKNTANIKRFVIKSWYKNENGIKIDCPKSNITQISVYSRHSSLLYDSERCAELNEEKDYTFLNFTVHCEKNISVNEGEILTLNNLKRFDTCLFLVNDNLHDQLTICPPVEDTCSNKSSSYDICQSYLAPTQNGYKNKHCFQCATNIKEDTEQSDVKMCSLKNFFPPKKGLKTAGLKNTFVKFELKTYYNKRYIIKKVRHPFPVYEFLGIEEVNILDADGKPMSSALTLSESRLCNSFENDRCCDCKVACFKHQSCCMDVLWDENKRIDMKTYKQELIRHSKQHKQYSCEKVMLRNFFVPTEKYYKMIKICSSKTNRLNMEDCVHPDYIMPVLGNDGHVYRNEFCARCNNIANFSFIDIHLESDRSVLKECPTFVYEDKCPKNSYFYNLCHSYQSGVGHYQNIFCHLCELNETRSKEASLLFSETCPGYSSTIIPWSTLIVFNEKQVLEIQDESCKLVGKTYSPRLKKCVDLEIHCSYDFELEGFSCPSKTKKRIDDANLEKCILKNTPTLFYLHETQKNKSGDWHHLDKNYFSSKNLHINISLHDETESHIIYRIHEMMQNENQTIYDILFKYNSRDDFSGKFLLTTSNQLLFNQYHNISFKNNFPKNKLCFKPQLLDLNAINLTSYCDVFFDGRKYNWRTISVWVTLQKNEIIYHVMKCERFYLQSNCNMQTIKNTNLTIHQDGRVTYNQLNDFNHTFDIEEYIPTSQGIALCSQTLNRNPEKERLWFAIGEAEIYVAYIGTVISICSYLFIIATFSCFKELRTNPGLCTLSLSVCLLIGDFSYILGGILEDTGNSQGNPSACITLALLMHFGIIAAYIWSSLIAYDIMSTFVTCRSFHVTRSRLCFAYYCILVYVLASTVVIVAAVLDHLQIVSVGYGENGICTLNKQMGRLYFYIIPLIVTFAMSFVFLIVTICKLICDKRQIDRVVKRQGTSNLSIAFVALKITLVLGICEGIGFIQMPEGNKSPEEKKVFQVMALLYTLLRSLRGLLIAMVYTCKKNILCRYYQKIIIRNSLQQMEYADARKENTEC